MFSIASLIVILNSIEIHVLRRTTKKHFYEKMLMSLSFSDLACGLFASVTVPYLSIVKNKLYIVLHWNVWGFALCYVTLISLMHLIIISADRLWAIGAPLNHRQYATKKKLVVALILSGSVPLIFIIVFICLVLINEMKPAEIYWFGTGTMFTVVARGVLINDIVLLICYSAIMWLVKRNKDIIKPSNSPRKTNTLVLCCSIVSVFVCFTTPFVVVFVTNWSSPQWSIKFATILFPFNQICNSIIYLVHKYRSTRPKNAASK